MNTDMVNMVSSVSIPIVIVMVLFFIILTGFIIAMFVSPKFKGKIMGRQFKAIDHMLDASGDTMVNLTTKSAKISRKATELAKDDLKAVSDAKADIEKGAIKTRFRAMRDGLMGDDAVFCRYCGKEIAADSKFCQHCGKKQ